MELKDTRAGEEHLTCKIVHSLNCIGLSVSSWIKWDVSGTKENISSVFNFI